jgi:hypothetical protein
MNTVWPVGTETSGVCLRSVLFSPQNSFCKSSRIFSKKRGRYFLGFFAPTFASSAASNT